ncbi:hypothetical protein [Staphylococcus equorum]|uniref:hypothetical protein n=1 Tax=Staphylococcus equorum TaxID=246432 RepID=UPI0035939386
MTYREAVKHIRKLEQENEKLRERNKKLEKRCNQKVRRNVRGGLQQMKIEDLESKYNDMKAERDTLIDDLPWYKAKVGRLEDGIKTLERKNVDARTLNWELKGYADMYKEDSDKYKSLLSEISQHIGSKPSSSTYKYFRAKLDCLGIKEGEW